MCLLACAARLSACVPAVALDRRQLLDRFNQHTKHCKACRTAYERTTAAHKVVGVLALVTASAALMAAMLAATGAVLVAPGAAATAAAQASAGSTWGLPAVLTVAAAVLGGAYVALSQLVQKFVFVDYDSHHVGKQPSH